MSYFEILVEGSSDVPTIREVMIRKFGLEENKNFRIHAHKGRGKLPLNPLGQANPKHQTLLDQLPAKLRGFSYLGENDCVVVIVDADDTPCEQLLNDLNSMLQGLPRKPHHVLFRLAIEETESWFIADSTAVLKAYPKAKVQKMRGIKPDAIVGAWEVLAEAVGAKRQEVTGADKYAWAEKIAPHLDFDNPPSPSLACLIDGIDQQLNHC
jgi:hypothetical protein